MKTLGKWGLGMRWLPSPFPLLVFLFSLGLPGLSFGEEKGGGEALDWDSLEPAAPLHLMGSAVKLRDALFEVYLFEDERRNQFYDSNRGFFISDDGFAICPLFPVCVGRQLGFGVIEAGKGGVPTLLEAPVVYGLFPEADLALVKFEHRPAGHLSLAARDVPLGTWVAHLTPPGLTTPEYGPVLFHGRTAVASADWLKGVVDPVKRYSIALPRRRNDSEVYRQGEPLVDESGEVVAVLVGFGNLGIQTLRYGVPANEFRDRVDDAMREGKPMTLPLPEAVNPYDPARLDPMYLAYGGAMLGGRVAEARGILESLSEKYPDSVGVRNELYRFGFQTLEAMKEAGAPDWEAQANRLLVEVVTHRYAKTDPLWRQARYHQRLGALYRLSDKEEDAVRELTLADKLDPDCQACVDLAVFYQVRGDEEQAKHYLERAAERWPDHIGFWVELGKMSEGEAQRTCFGRAQLLRSLYGAK